MVFEFNRVNLASGFAFGYDPTSRCHKKEFLLKFSRDRRRYLQWLFDAKKRYGLSVLIYVATSNHVHFLVRDKGGRDVIPKSISNGASKGKSPLGGRRIFALHDPWGPLNARYSLWPEPVPYDLIADDLYLVVG